MKDLPVFNGSIQDLNHRLFVQLGRWPDFDESGFIITALRGGQAFWTRHGDARIIRRRRIMALSRQSTPRRK